MDGAASGAIFRRLGNGRLGKRARPDGPAELSGLRLFRVAYFRVVLHDPFVRISVDESARTLPVRRWGRHDPSRGHSGGQGLPAGVRATVPQCACPAQSARLIVPTRTVFSPLVCLLCLSPAGWAKA